MPNADVKNALDRARNLFLGRPSAAKKKNAFAKATWAGGLRCEVNGPENEAATTDMPAPLGGQGGGANPGWLLRAAMASCTATAIAMKAATAGIELERLEVEVNSETDARGLVGIEDVPTNLDQITMRISISASNATKYDLLELAKSGNAISPVSATLQQISTVKTEVQVV